MHGFFKNCFNGTWASAGIVYYINPTHPNPTGKYWSRSSYWTKYPWYTTMLSNPLTVTNTPTYRYGTYSINPQLSNMNNGTARACWDYGNVLVQWDGGSGTLEDIGLIDQGKWLVLMLI